MFILQKAAPVSSTIRRSALHVAPVAYIIKIAFFNDLSLKSKPSDLPENLTSLCFKERFVFHLRKVLPLPAVSLSDAADNPQVRQMLLSTWSYEVEKVASLCLL